MRLALFTACACAILLYGCGKEDRETRLYGQNAAMIAGDTAPWKSDRFQNNEENWNQEMEKRARLQNEYSRIR